ncbi:MAG: hypothetical protein JOZ69_05745 [Myxococcales bacterium]|nr:hypothetical protein [Myxococcales bacterium]
MKPSDHPDFFRMPAPEGRSRESTIRLDATGRFWHDGRPVEHPGLAAALHTWIARHPDDGRYVLTNGYDWTYFTVEDAPYTVRALRIEPDRILLLLSDGTEEAWDPARSRVAPGDALYAEVKAAAPGGPFEARFSRFAQSSLGPVLVLARAPAGGETGAAAPADGTPGAPAGLPEVVVGGRAVAIGAARTRLG